MKIRAVHTTAACLLVACTAAVAQNQGTILVANQKDHTVSVIDAATAKQVAAIPEDRVTGHEVWHSSVRGRFRYSVSQSEVR